MRKKKNREVNIFSASVVDLFASGLGVFLIVSIIALVNQKKENSKMSADSNDNPIIKELSGKVDKLTKELSDKNQENYKYRIESIEKVMNDKSAQQLVVDMDKALLELEFIRRQQKNKLEIEALRTELSKSKNINKELNKMILRLKGSSLRNNQSEFHSFEVGTKFKLENVHFFPGTDRPIEPYASAEILNFSEFLKKNPSIQIEVSGHIYQSKKNIEKGSDEDDYNLSGRRANVVCSKLIEFGVNDSRLRCVGYGAKRYLYLSNDQYSKEAQLNRRVEVEILSK